jgi:hypothetical protein
MLKKCKHCTKKCKRYADKCKYSDENVNILMISGYLHL